MRERYSDFRLVVRVRCNLCGATADGLTDFACPGSETPDLPDGWDWHAEMYEERRPRCTACGDVDRATMERYRQEKEARLRKKAEARQRAKERRAAKAGER